MAYTPNSPAWTKGTPPSEGGTEAGNDAIGGLMTAARMNHIEQGLVAVAEQADTTDTTVSGLQTDVSGLQGAGYQDAEQVQALINAALEAAYDPPCAATVASASTVLFRFSEDGSTFDFLGGTFGWFATHNHRGVITAASALNIPFVTGRVIILDTTDGDNPTLTTRALAPSMELAEAEYVVGNMFNEGTAPAVPTVVINGAGTYKYTATE